MINPLELGRRVSLRALTASDEPWAQALHTDGDALISYRLRGSTPAPEAFHRFLWDQALVNLVVTDDEGRRAGLVSAFGANQRHGYCYLAAIGDAEARQRGLVLEGAAAALSYLFHVFPLRKVYAEVLRSNLAQISSGLGRYFTEEGCLVDHEWVHGGYEDLLILAVHRSAWRAHHERLFGPEAPPI